MLIDTHSHIYSDDFSQDSDEVILNAVHNGVKKIVLPNIDSSSIKRMLDLADAYPEVCYPLMGLHPTSVEEDYEDELHAVEFWLERRKFYGIGEIGIDLYWNRVLLRQQEEVFRRQLQMAAAMDLPVVIHVRESFNEVFSILRKEQKGSLRGVFHCFTGTSEEAEKIIDLGFYLGIGGVVTFKNSHLGQVIREKGIHHMVLETDSPYLAPSPYRGRRNESAYLVHVAMKVAEVVQRPFQEVAAITTKNATQLFGLEP